MAWLRERIEVARKIFDRPWVKRALVLWGLIAAYDTFVSQFVPNELAKRFPKMHELIAETSGWLPWWGWLLVLAAIIAVACFEYAVRKTRVLHRHPVQSAIVPQAEVRTIAKTVFVPDIDARAAFFQILEKSEWRQHQLRATTDTSYLVRVWLEVRLSDEIHKALVNSRLDSWGEEILPSGATAPERPIPANTWINIEIVFDRLNVPRTQANWRTTTYGGTGKMAWVGVKFSKKQIFELFLLAEQDGEISLFEAATRAYGQTKESPISILAEGLANTSDDILIWYCNEMTRYLNGKQPLVVLRGIKPPSREKEEIYMAALSRYEFIVEHNAIVLQERTGSLRYVSLSVSASEVNSAIAELARREA